MTRQLGADPENTSSKHEFELQKVRLFVQEELIRTGYIEGPARTGWRCRDLVGAPTELGQQNEVILEGRAAAVFSCGMVVEESYAYEATALAQFAERLRTYREAAAELLAYVDEHERSIVADLSNGDLARDAGLAFGAQPTVNEPMDWHLYASTLGRITCDRMRADRLQEALDARKPAPVKAGFYGGGGRNRGSIANFVGLLDREGVDDAGMTEVLLRMPARPPSHLDELHWRDECDDAIANVRRLKNRLKAEAIPGLTDETRSVVDRVPIERRVCVVMSKLDGQGRPITALVGGSYAVPSTDSDGSALDQNWTTFELTART